MAWINRVQDIFGKRFPAYLQRHGKSLYNRLDWKKEKERAIVRFLGDSSNLDRQKIPSKTKTLCPIWKKKNMMMFEVPCDIPLAQLKEMPLTLEIYDYEAVGESALVRFLPLLTLLQAKMK